MKPRDKHTLEKQLAQEPSLSWQALMLQNAIAGFAGTVRAKLPIGKQVTARVLPDAGLGYLDIPCTISRHQYPDAEIAEYGMLVTVADELLPQLAPWRITTTKDRDNGRLLVMVKWFELLETL